MQNVIALEKVGITDIEVVGGKNASLGEMIQHLTSAGINVPHGFATTTLAYRKFLSQNNLDKKIYQALASVSANDLQTLNKTAANIRQWILDTPFLAEFKNDVNEAYHHLNGKELFTVAVRSSATAEDLPEASFAGQQETYLNVCGLEDVLLAIKKVFASLFTERAISYRNNYNIDHAKVSISAGIQRMVRSDQASSGVLFTLDTESGFDQVILITGVYGLGETIVQGAVNPDEFYVYKPALQKGQSAILRRNLGDKAIKMVYGSKAGTTLMTKTMDVVEAERRKFCINDEDIISLAKQALLIEKHYGKPMDIEWAKDGVDGKIYIVQARPETVKSHQHEIERFRLLEKGAVKTKGQSIGQRIGEGIARVVLDPKEMNVMQPGEILVTDMTDPDWEPIMKLAAGIVTNRGGRTCHAAIVARELGIPAVVGCNNATTTIQSGDPITVSCAEGEIGYVYEGLLQYKIDKVTINDMPKIPAKICINLGNPEKAFLYRSLPNDGVGLARLEFIIGNMVGIHPNAILQFATLAEDLKQDIANKTAAYSSPVEFYIEKLREGISVISAAFYPKPVIFRFSDFKSNEYANLIGGQLFEPHEENPMLGFRGAARYIDDHFRACFELECKAFKRVRDEMGLDNTQIMIPFVRTISEIKNVIHLMESLGLKRGVNDLKIYMMCEIPSNIILAEEFLQYVDGFSIGSNDLTQLTLGLDRDSALVAPLFDERNEAVKALLQQVIAICNKNNKYVGICGQAPSDYPELAQWLVQQGIQSLSLSPDSIVETWLMLAKQ